MNDHHREVARNKFLDSHGWRGAVVDPLASDASFRRYYRLVDGHCRALLMDAPPDKENTLAYTIVAHHLNALGMSAPEIYADDLQQGFALIEDFGRDTFTKLLRDGNDEQQLYELAVDTLIHLHQMPEAASCDCAAYDEAVLLREAALFVDWYLPAVLGYTTSQDVRSAYIQAWASTLEGMPKYHPTLVLRDFHVDNLIVLSEREGVARCGLLDFQDALIGHPAYDLMSLLEDARRDVSDGLTETIRRRYANACLANDHHEFDDWYALLGAQRHAKVAGIFVRLMVRDGKSVYLKHLPRVMRLLARNLSHPRLGAVNDWFNEHASISSVQLSQFIQTHSSS